MNTTLSQKAFTVLAVAFCVATTAVAQGIEARRDAVVLFGATANCTKPATIDWRKIRGETAEWKIIKSEGVRKGSARYSLLISDMTKRIKTQVRKVARDKGNDCVVRKGDVSDAKGLRIDDLTKAVVKALESEDDDS